MIPGATTASRVPSGMVALKNIVDACVKLATNSESVHERIYKQMEAANPTGASVTIALMLIEIWRVSGFKSGKGWRKWEVTLQRIWRKPKKLQRRIVVFKI